MARAVGAQRPRLSSRDLRDSLVSTLRALCEKEKSVTHVCNETGINRQQFAKYLDGRSMPSFENAMRIADYFDITCEELFGFRTVRDVVGFEFPVAIDENSLAYKANRAIEAIESASENGEPPANGYYFCYVNAASDNPQFSRSYIKSLMRIERVGNEIVTERRQYLQKQHGITRSKIKYYGIGHVIEGMLSIRYCDPVENDHLSSILVRSHHFQGNNLAGILVGRRKTHGGEVGASAVFLEFIEERPNLKATIGQCGIFDYGQGHATREIEDVLKAKTNQDGSGLIIR